MSPIHEELERFRRFATDQLAQGVVVDSLDDLWLAWHDLEDRDQVDAAIRRGLKDVNEGRFESAEACNQALRTEFGLPDR